MSTETLDRLCREALQRIIKAINYSAGQHIRAIKTKKSMNVISKNETTAVQGARP